jgi:hypothetical protein
MRNRIGIAEELEKAARLLREAEHFEKDITPGHPRIKSDDDQARLIIAQQGAEVSFEYRIVEGV